jgi:hypothetical protein
MSKSLNKTDTPYLKLANGRIRQGDILRDINFIYEWRLEDENSNKYIVKDYEFAYTVILSQDCDLEQDSVNRTNINDKNQDAYIPSILVCPAYDETKFRKGLHLDDYDLLMEEKHSKEWNYIRSNREPRYHYLMPDPNFQAPELVLDFKHFYTLPNKFLYSIYNNEYQKHYLASLKILFRERLCQRFSYYISRVGLPEIEKDGS